jgi:peroxiredoxin
VFAGAACSGNTQSEEYTQKAPAAATASVDGIPYPNDHIGNKARKGTVAGDRIANLSFSGYLEGNTESTLTGISLARYYDPETKRAKLLHIFVAAGWCPICRSESTQLTTSYDALHKDGLVVLTVLVNGAKQSIGPSLTELKTWSETHRFSADLALDARARSFSAFSISGVPWNAQVDVRTMEILTIAEGAPRDLKAWDQQGLAWVAAHPPSYATITMPAP